MTEKNYKHWDEKWRELVEPLEKLSTLLNEKFNDGASVFEQIGHYRMGASAQTRLAKLETFSNFIRSKDKNDNYLLWLKDNLPASFFSELQTGFTWNKNAKTVTADKNAYEGLSKVIDAFAKLEPFIPSENEETGIANWCSMYLAAHCVLGVDSARIVAQSRSVHGNVMRARVKDWLDAELGKWQTVVTSIDSTANQKPNVYQLMLLRKALEQIAEPRLEALDLLADSEFMRVMSAICEQLLGQTDVLYLADYCKLIAGAKVEQKNKCYQAWKSFVERNIERHSDDRYLYGNISEKHSRSRNFSLPHYWHSLFTLQTVEAGSMDSSLRWCFSAKKAKSVENHLSTSPTNGGYWMDDGIFILALQSLSIDEIETPGAILNKDKDMNSDSSKGDGSSNGSETISKQFEKRRAKLHRDLKAIKARNYLVEASIFDDADDEWSLLTQTGPETLKIIIFEDAKKPQALAMWMSICAQLYVCQTELRLKGQSFPQDLEQAVDRLFQILSEHKQNPTFLQLETPMVAVAFRTWNSLLSGRSTVNELMTQVTAADDWHCNLAFGCVEQLNHWLSTLVQDLRPIETHFLNQHAQLDKAMQLLIQNQTFALSAHPLTYKNASLYGYRSADEATIRNAQLSIEAANVMVNNQISWVASILEKIQSLMVTPTFARLDRQTRGKAEPTLPQLHYSARRKEGESSQSLQFYTTVAIGQELSLRSAIVLCTTSEKFIFGIAPMFTGDNIGQAHVLMKSDEALVTFEGGPIERLQLYLEHSQLRQFNLILDAEDIEVSIALLHLPDRPQM